MPAFSGHLQIRAAAREDGVTYLAEQALRAPFHLSKPYWEGRALVVQLVNPTAGILEGDTLRAAVKVDAGARVLLTTPAASRVFTMREGEARSEQYFEVQSGAWLEVSPEPLVPHRASRFRQTTRVQLEPGAEMVYGDFFMPGRMARGEVWAWDELVLTLDVQSGATVLVRERFCQSGESLRALAALAGREAGACFANLVLVSPALVRGDWRETLTALHHPGCWVGVSPLRGAGEAWSVKLVAEDSIALRDAYAAFRERMAGHLPGLAVPMRKN